jgi:hypothetical protein
MISLCSLFSVCPPLVLLAITTPLLVPTGTNRMRGKGIGEGRRREKELEEKIQEY